ncbi:Hypothetical predicted protein [Octopus vulgaris]|uniref:Uncharacterized protein n=1 Tax=Octopus vulgaris TaxID=6645 RepID=A0AA36BCH5_OCTVU|nr:Hypothetical predicted protein [Octopus vulgaris]
MVRNLETYNYNAKSQVMSFREHVAGAQKRKNRENLPNDRKRMAEIMDQYISVTLLSSNSNEPMPGEDRQANNNGNAKQQQKRGYDEDSQQIATFSAAEGNVKDLYDAFCQQPLPIAEDMVVQQETVTITTDPGSWPETISDGTRTVIMKLGVLQPFNYNHTRASPSRINALKSALVLDYKFGGDDVSNVFIAIFSQVL